MPRIAIIHPEGNFNNNPNLSGLLCLLSESGFDIDLYCQHRDETDQSAPAARVHVIRTSVPGAFTHDTPVVFPSIAQVDPIESARAIAPTISKPDLIIGVDRGIIEAAALAHEWAIPLGLISYEIWFGEETYPAFKVPEIAACENLAFAVCQDRVRSAELCRENRIPLDRLIDIPVAGRGVRRCEKTRAIHSALGLDSARKIALYMGELSGTWNGIDEILASTAAWPEEWVLILHHRYGNGAALDLVSKVLASGRKNVLFSPFATLPFDRMADLLGAVDLGFAFYRAVAGHPTSGRNLTCLGMASGKIATYLQHGVPILVNEIGEMSDHVKNSGLGGVVDSGSEIPAALRRFTETADALNRERCSTFFSNYLDLDRTALPLISRIMALV